MESLNTIKIHVERVYVFWPSSEVLFMANLMVKKTSPMSLAIHHLHVEIEDANLTWQKVSEYDQEIPKSHNADYQRHR